MILKIVFPLLLGLFIGSFINVLIYRIPKNEGFLLGRSYCDNCKKNLFWYDLVPVISYLFLKGKCRFCKKRINIQLPVVEIITALLFTVTFIKFSIISVNLFFYLFVICCLVVIFFVDLNKGIIPDKILYPIFVIALIFVFYSSSNFINHVISGLVSFLFFLSLYLITKGKGMGFGDVKFAAVLGILLGFPGVIICFYTAFLTGGLVGLILIIWGKKRFKKDTMAFGPFLSFGAVVAIFLGDLLVSRLLNFLQ